VTTLRDLPDEIFYCLRGARGHVFDEYQPLGRRTQWGQPVEYRCLRCGKLRHDIYDSTGNLSWRGYDKPKGYPEIPPHTADDVRLEVIRRATERRRSSEPGQRRSTLTFSTRGLRAV